MKRRLWLFVSAVSAVWVLSSSWAAATKYEIWKPPVVNELTGNVDHPSLDLEWLSNHAAVLLAEYHTTVLIEAPADQHDALLAAAASRGINIRAREDFDRIEINGYRFESDSAPVILDPALRIDEYDAPIGLYLVQLIGPNRGEWEAALQHAASIIHYYPENTYLVKIPPPLRATVSALGSVQHVSVYQPAFKIQPNVLRSSERQRVVVQMDRELAEATTNPVIRQLLGATPFDAEGDLVTVKAELDRDQVIEAARQPEVVWIERSLTGSFSDERQANVVAGKHNGSQPTDPATYHTWLEAKGFCTSSSPPPGCYDYWTRVGVFDSGLDENICSVDGGTCMAAGDTRDRHIDLGDREKYFICGTSTGCLGETRYYYRDVAPHGTMTASVLAGDPLAGTGLQDGDSYYLGTGIAPLAEIVTVKLGRRDFFTDYTAGDFENLVDRVRLKWARHINNSWNYNTFEDDSSLGYTTISQKFDELVRDSSGGFNQFDHPMTIVFSAGNHDGGDENTHNPYHYVEAPANAKNVISVGSSESYRTMGFECFAASDIRNIESHSLRGIKYDSGRYKPDLVAPSTRLAAARSQYWGQPGPEDDDYVAYCGTSAAAPVVTGAAVLAETWYYYNNGSTLPSPAMIKAMLVAHADDLAGGVDQATGQPVGVSPEMNQGWGRVNLDNLFQDQVDVRFFDEDHTIGGARRFTSLGAPGWTVNLDVDDQGSDVLVVLAFTDRFAAAGAYILRVNDLDLYVIDGAYKYQGNLFKSNGYTYRGTSMWLPDFDNNVEVIRIPAGEIVNGDFAVEVVAHLSAKAVPGLDGGMANQDFALYVYNAN